MEAIEGKSALELLSMGTKAYWLRKYQDAASYLSKSSEMLVAEHKDDKHNTLGNVYLFYGKSLLELAREDGDPLGDAVPKEVGIEDEEEDVEVEEDEEAGEEEEKKTTDGDEATKSTAEEKSKTEDTKKEAAASGDAADDADKTEDKDNVADISMNGEPASSVDEPSEGESDDDDVEEQDAGEGGSGEQKEEEEEPTDLQLAWEVLELGKIILERRGEEGREDYSDCLVTLGEVSLESENFDSAIADITAGLDIQKEIYTESKDMRKLAQTYYKLGMALTAHNRIEEGIVNYETTLRLLRERLTVLEAIAEPGASDADEIKDIKALIPELEEKIADLKNYKEEAAKKSDEEPTPSSPEKKANNITHLVKRKRKLEDVAEEAAENAAKKAAQ